MKAKFMIALPVLAVLCAVAAYVAGIAYMRSQVSAGIEQTLSYLNGDDIVLGSGTGDFLPEVRKALQTGGVRLAYRVEDDRFFTEEALLTLADAERSFEVPFRIIYPSPLAARIMIDPDPGMFHGDALAQYDFISEKLSQLEDFAPGSVQVSVTLLHSLCPSVLDAQAVIEAEYLNVSREELRELAVHDLDYDNRFALQARYRIRQGRKVQMAVDIRNMITYDSVVGRFFVSSSQTGARIFEDPGQLAMGIRDYFDIDMIVKDARLDLRGVMRDSRYFDVDYTLSGDFNIDHHLADSPLSVEVSGRIGTLDLNYINQLREHGGSRTLLGSVFDEQLFRDRTLRLSVERGMLAMSSNVLYGIFMEPGPEHTDQDLEAMLGTTIRTAFALEAQASNFMSGSSGSGLRMDLDYTIRTDHERVMRDIRSSLAELELLHPVEPAPARMLTGHLSFDGERLTAGALQGSGL